MSLSTSASRRLGRRSRLVIGAITMTAVAVPALAFQPVASVYANAPVDYPTLSKGSRGTDVVALQYLLTKRGYALTADGAFGSGTETKVKSFQTASGLTSDGVVGPGTWASLVSTLTTSTTQNTTGDHVKAITSLLQKRDSSVTVTSTYSTTVRDKVKNFQTHMGLSSDGIVGANSWKYLLFHYEQPNDWTNLCKGLDGTVDTANYAAEGWGTSQTVAFLEWAGAQTKAAHGQKVAFRDLSKEHGGEFTDGQHASHRYGMDIDIRPMSTGSVQCSSALNRWSSSYSSSRTITLAKKLKEASSGLGRDLHMVTYFNDPVVQAAVPEVSTLANHDDHLHTRFCTSYFPASSSYDC